MPRKGLVKLIRGFFAGRVRGERFLLFWAKNPYESIRPNHFAAFTQETIYYIMEIETCGNLLKKHLSDSVMDKRDEYKAQTNKVDIFS